MTSIYNHKNNFRHKKGEHSFIHTLIPLLALCLSYKISKQEIHHKLCNDPEFNSFIQEGYTVE